MRLRQPTEVRLQSWQTDVDNNGIRRITARLLLHCFGAQRRTPQIMAHIRDWLGSQAPVLYVSGLEYADSLDDPVYLSRIELRQIGRHVEREKILMDRFVQDIMQTLNLQNPRPGHSPKGTRDKLDFLCDDGEGRSVVVELKRGDGERRVVEQVLRYIDQLRKSGEGVSPRGLIVSGIADLSTREALEELEPDYHIDWYIYGVGDGESIRLQQIAVESRRL